MHKSIQDQVRESPAFSNDEKVEIITAMEEIINTPEIAEKCGYENKTYRVFEKKEMLSGLMYWHKTPQGYQYWRDINKRLTGNKYL